MSKRWFFAAVVGLWVASILGLWLLWGTGEVSAMPNFGRQMNAACMMCHSTIPTLNPIGYRFRDAGFRIPEDIGSVKEQTWDKYLTARIQAKYRVRDISPAGGEDHTNQLEFHELTLYPLAGPLGRYYSSLVELSIAPEEFAGLENGYFRFTYGSDQLYFKTRLGIFHPWEGFGASDRPVSLRRPLFQTTPANKNQNTFFTQWGFDQAGWEVGASAVSFLGYSTLNFTIFNGLLLRKEEEAFKAFPAAGGDLSKFGDKQLLSRSDKDYQIVLNHLIGESGAGLSLYYYNGTFNLPIDQTGDVERSNLWKNRFWRFAAYGSSPIVMLSQLQKGVSLSAQLKGGISVGRDRFIDPATGQVQGHFGNFGWFTTLELPVWLYLTPAIRFDYFDPDQSKGDNHIRAWTFSLNAPLQDGLQFIAEYQNKVTEQPGKGDKTENNFELRLIFIW